MRILTLAAVLGMAAAPAMAQTQAIADVLGDTIAIERVADLCPDVYPDIALIEKAEDDAFAYATAIYGENEAAELLGSPEMASRINAAADRIFTEFVQSAGSETRLCSHVGTATVPGFTRTPVESQETRDAEPAAPQPEPAPLPAQELTPLVPFY